MSKLYPPTISGIIPAFYGTTIVVPFSMNRAIGINDISGYALKVKNVNGELLGIIDHDGKEINEISFEWPDKEGFQEPNRFYKVQLAYKDKNGEYGYFSTVGVVKHTAAPEIRIEGLDSNQINAHLAYYHGVYIPNEEKDKFEKMYSSKFILYDENQNIIHESEEKLHNSINDYDENSNAQIEEFHLSYDLELNKIYYIEFIVTTINKLIVHTPKYKIAVKENINFDLGAYLQGELNYDEAFIKLTLQAEDEDKYISGKFVISRASSKNNYAWEELKRFEIPSIKVKDWHFEDYTVEQGVSYKYGIQQFNDNQIYTSRVTIKENDQDKIIKADFEDSFLYDGVRLLKIRFNPKVSSYKNDIPENKTDTMGSKYPFITRNGRVNYKDFPIAGLISHQMDDIEKFMTKEELGFHKLGIHRIENGARADVRVDLNGNIIEGQEVCADEHKEYFYDNNLTTDNIAAERIFKNEVLNWLTNGKPKLFKSPTEGNFIVQLMNVSLSPIDTLGRMLHSFTCNAYEIAALNLTNLATFKLINESIDFESPYAINSSPLYMYIDNNKLETIDGYYNIEIEPSYWVYFEDFMPGSKVRINSQDIIIGSTGNYYYDGNDPITSIGIFKEDYDKYHVGAITTRFKLNIKSNFDNLESVKTYEVPIRQYIGPVGDIIGDICPIDSGNKIFRTINSFYVLRFMRKAIDYIYMNKSDKDKKEITYYYDYQGKQPINEDDLLPIGFYIIKLVDTKKRSFLDYGKDKSMYTNSYRYFNGEKFLVKENENISNLFNITLNKNESLSVWDKAVIEYPYDEVNLLNPQNIEIGAGVICEIGYTMMEKTYSVEQGGNTNVSTS